MSLKRAYKGVTMTRPIVPAPEDPAAPKTEEYLDTTFAGDVTFSKPLGIDQEAALESADAEIQALIQANQYGPASLMRAMLSGILPCVERMEVTGINPQPSLDNWPLRPRTQILSFTAWLWVEMGKLYTDSLEPIPNA